MKQGYPVCEIQKYQSSITCKLCAYKRMLRNESGKYLYKTELRDTNWEALKQYRQGRIVQVRKKQGMKEQMELKTVKFTDMTTKQDAEELKMFR